MIHRKNRSKQPKEQTKKIALGKSDKRKRNIGATKPQNTTEDGEKDICMGRNKYVETGVQRNNN